VKKLFIFLLIAVLFAGTISAQTRKDRQSNSNLITVEGILKLQKGFIAVESGETSYLVPILTRYIGFIEGMKEGTKVSVEGYAFRNILHPVKVTIEGKSYDFFVDGPGPEFGFRNDYPDRGRSNFGSGRNNSPILPNRRFAPRGRIWS